MSFWMWGSLLDHVWGWLRVVGVECVMLVLSRVFRVVVGIDFGVGVYGSGMGEGEVNVGVFIGDFEMGDL